MTEHKHEPIIDTNSLIVCRTCGKFLPYMETTISKVRSIKMAKQVLDEIAVAGRYRATGFSDGFVIYSKDKDGLREEITVEKLKKQEFVVKKTIRCIDS